MAYARLLGSVRREHGLNDPWDKHKRSREQFDSLFTDSKPAFCRPNPSDIGISKMQVKSEPYFKETKVSKPKGDYEHFISTVKVVEAIDAKFSVNYPNSSPLITYYGDFFYFSDKKTAISVRDELRQRFGIITEICYGHKGSKGKKGQVVEELKLSGDISGNKTE